jgi:hypothetical protein
MLAVAAAVGYAVGRTWFRVLLLVWAGGLAALAGYAGFRAAGWFEKHEGDCSDVCNETGIFAALFLGGNMVAWMLGVVVGGGFRVRADRRADLA